jgi:hypothetical protein
LSSRFRNFHFGIAGWMTRIHEETEDSNVRKEVTQQLQSLGYRACPEYGDASSVATRSVEARY